MEDEKNVGVRVESFLLNFVMMLRTYISVGDQKTPLGVCARRREDPRNVYVTVSGAGAAAAGRRQGTKHNQKPTDATAATAHTDTAFVRASHARTDDTIPT